MAPTFIASAIAVVANLLQLAGINVGSDALMTTVTTIITIVSGVVILLRQVQTGRATAFGARPKA